MQPQPSVPSVRLPLWWSFKREQKDFQGIQKSLPRWGKGDRDSEQRGLVARDKVDEAFPGAETPHPSALGCVYQINENLWEGSFYPRMPDGKRKKFNVYAKTREECEKLLAEMITKKKAEIAEMKKKAKKA